MAISPMDIHHKEFSTVRMGGYNKEEVDTFLDTVADELDRLLHRTQEQSELAESMRQKASQFDDMQTTLQNALINAQKSADSIVQEARSQAEAQVKEAQEQSARILEEAQNERVRISQSFTGIREQVLRYVATIRELLDKNQALVKDYESRLAAAELKDQPLPASVSMPAEPVATQAVAAEARLGAGPKEPATSVVQEPSPARPEPVAPSAQLSELTRDKEAVPTAPEFAETAPLREAPVKPLAEEPLRETEPMHMEQEEPPAFVEPAPQSQEETSRSIYEQEMEPITGEKKMRGPKPEEEPPEETPGGEDKHFFWE